MTASGCDFSAADFGNWGDISCDGVAGTTNADGLTTIEVSKPEVFANGSVPSGYSLSGQSLLVKFNGTKAYALLKGKLALNAIVGYPLSTPSVLTKASKAAVLPAVARLVAKHHLS